MKGKLINVAIIFLAVIAAFLIWSEGNKYIGMICVWCIVALGFIKAYLNK